MLSAISLVFRYRRTTGIQRQQIKWFAYAAALNAFLVALDSLGLGDLLFRYSFGYGLWTLLGSLAFATLYVAVGVAILRYRLYDIDVLINRTLVYGSLTATLVAVYFAGVTATQAISRTLTGEVSQSQLATVVSTLFIAALFNPFRRRIQSFIDRRFYRNKYDARKTLETFSSRLRDETDLEKLGDHLVGAVGARRPLVVGDQAERAVGPEAPWSGPPRRFDVPDWRARSLDRRKVTHTRGPGAACASPPRCRPSFGRSSSCCVPVSQSIRTQV